MSAWFWFFGFYMNFILKMVVELNVVIGFVLLVFVYDDDDDNEEGTGMMMMEMINK